MKSVPKLIRRFVGITLISVLLLVILNIVIFFFIGLLQTPSGSPYTTADEIGKAISKTASGYVLEDAYREELQKENAWAILIEEKTHSVVWHTEDLPEGIPTSFSLADISDLTLGYVSDHPTYVGEAEDGIVVLGYPTDRYWKSMWPTWDYDFIAKLPQILLTALLCNLILIFFIYMTVTGSLIRSVDPIIAGIKSLTTANRPYVKEKGIFSEVASSINQAAELLGDQERMLEKKETARANWIAGVSHDIRTPLSMVMACAGQLAEEPCMTGQPRKKAEIIVKQSQRMRDLIGDLNLASKLEYNMQPIHRKQENLVAIARQVAVDFINTDMEEKHPIAWVTDEALTCCMVNGDKALLKRAVGNLIQNSIRHNERGCRIYVGVFTEKGTCTVAVDDDGVGADDRQFEKINRAPHYMVCDENTEDQRHGLGLLIVKQIAHAHGGTAAVRHSPYGGFRAEIRLPMQ